MKILSGISNVKRDCVFKATDYQILLVDQVAVEDIDIDERTEYRWLDLRELSRIEVVRNAVDPARRERLAEEKADVQYTQKKNRAFTNAIMGAVVGAAIDSAPDEGDSIIDGAVIGGLVGYALSDTSRPIAVVDLTENKEHFVNLYFRDQTSVTVEATNGEIAQLCRLVNNTNPGITQISPSIKVYGPSKEQLARARELRLSRDIERRIPQGLRKAEEFSFFALFGGAVATACLIVHASAHGAGVLHIGGGVLGSALAIAGYSIIASLGKHRNKARTVLTQSIA